MLIFISAIFSGWIIFEIFFYYRKTGPKSGAKLIVPWWLQLGLDLMLAGTQVLVIIFFFAKPFSQTPALPTHPLLAGGIMISGLLLRWYAIQVLGKYDTCDIAVFESHRIIEAGPYKLIRHPQHLGSWITFFGAGFLLVSYFRWLVWGIPLLVLAIKIFREELALTQIWGENYENYRRRTWFIIPYLV